MSDNHLHFNDEVENEIQVKIDSFLPDLPIEGKKRVIPIIRFTTYWACIARTWIKLPVPTLKSIEYLMENVFAHDLFEMSQYDEPLSFFSSYRTRSPELADSLLKILPEGRTRESSENLIKEIAITDAEKFDGLLMIAYGLGVLHHEGLKEVSEMLTDLIEPRVFLDELRVVAGRFVEVFHNDLKRMDIPPFRV